MGTQIKRELLNKQEKWIRKILRKPKKFQIESQIFDIHGVMYCITDECINVFVILKNRDVKRIDVVENKFQNKVRFKEKIEKILTKSEINYFDEKSTEENDIVDEKNRFYCSTDYSYICFLF